MGSKKQALAEKIAGNPPNKKHRQTVQETYNSSSVCGDKSINALFAQRRRMGFHKVETLSVKDGVDQPVGNMASYLNDYPEIPLDGYEKNHKMLGNFQVRISQYQKIEQFGGIMLSMLFFKIFFGSHSQLKYWKRLMTGSKHFPMAYEITIIRLMVPKSGDHQCIW